MRRFLLLSLGLVLCGGAPAAAQEAPLEPGVRVRARLHPDGRRVVGRVVAARGDTLWIARASESPDSVVALPTARVARLDRSRGRRRHVARNAGIGALVGVAAGGLAAITSQSDPDDYLVFTPLQVGAAVGILVGVPATVVGALTGLVPTESWERLPSAAPPAAARGGLSVRPKVGTMRVPVRGAPPARALTLGLTLRPR